MNQNELIGETRGGNLHSENQDRIFTRTIQLQECDDLVHFFGVADGISRSDYGASVARWLCEKHFAEDQILAGQFESMANQVKTYLYCLRGSFRDEFKDFTGMLSSGAALSVCAMHSNKADCFWVGDCPIFHTNLGDEGYRTRQITKPDFNPVLSTLTDWFGGDAPFKVKHAQVTLSQGSIMTVASDGALCDAESLNERYVDNEFSKELLMGIIDQAVNRPRSDDASVVACRMSHQQNI